MWPFTGSYHYQNITCQQCPYGGRCEQGITAVANFWGYIDAGAVRFQHCPKGYCCTRKACTRYDTCAPHRVGRLCGACAAGYSEALFSSQCIRDDDCDSTYLWALAIFSGVSYAIFLLLQKDIRDLMFLNNVNFAAMPLPGRGRSKRSRSSSSRRRRRSSGAGMIPLELRGTAMSLPLKDEIEVESLPPETHDYDNHTPDAALCYTNQNGGGGGGSGGGLRKRLYVDDNKTDESQRDDVDAAPEEAPADNGASFLIILFYYFQDAQLLHIKTMFETEENKTREIFREILSGLFKFRVEFFTFMDNMCFLAGITPTRKLLLKVVLVPFVLLVFGIMYLFYRLALCFGGSGSGGDVKRRAATTTKSSHLMMNGGVTAGAASPAAAYHRNNATAADVSDAAKPTTSKTFGRRLATGFVLALLFTYQMLATTCFTLLNCVPVGNEHVIFIEGTITCYNTMQYVVMGYTAVCIVPFFLVLMIGPGMLRHGYIGLPQFFCACLIPLPFLLKWTIKRLRVKGREPDNLPVHSEEANAVMAILQGPFKDNINSYFGPICGAGLLLGRRLILIILFTFVNDSLPRMLGMMALCFVVLLHHVHTLPYKDTRGNIAGSASASGLLLVGGINLVRAGFEAAEYDPQGPNKTLMNVFHELELVLMLWIPALVMGVAILLMCVRIVLLSWKRCCRKYEKRDSEML